MSNRIVVTIGGRSYTIVAQEDPQYMESIAKRVDEEIRKVTRGSALSPHDSAVLAALNLADQCQRAYEKADHLRAQLKSYLAEGAELNLELKRLQRELQALEKNGGNP